MTKRVVPPTTGFVLDNHLRRIRALEALEPDICCHPPWVRVMLREDDPVTIPDGSNTQINFDPDIVWGSDDWESFFSLAIVGGGPFAGMISSIVPITEGGGRYAWSAEAKWNNTFAETCHLELSESSTEEWSFSKMQSYNAIPGLSVQGTQTFYFEEQHGGGTGFELAAAHGNAVDQDINGIYFQMTYLGSFSFTSTSTLDGFMQ